MTRSLLGLELRRARRRLMRAPGFSLSVVLLLGLSVGGMAAVATTAWSLFERSLPYPDVEQLVTVSLWSSEREKHHGLSEPLVEALNDEERFGTLAIAGRPFGLELADGARVPAGRMDHRLLSVLNVAPLIGRAFNEQDVRPGSERVALISTGFWRSRFGGDADIVNRTLELTDGRYRIIGVLPQWFAIPESATEIWLPMTLGPEQMTPERYGFLTGDAVIARRDAAVDPAIYQGQLSSRLTTDERLRVWRRNDRIEFPVRPLRELWSADQRDSLALLAAATGVVLLAAWLNLTGLWMARWSGRDREFTIQFALGARSRRVMLGVTAEYVLLAIPGLLLAMLVASLAIDLLYGLGVLEDNGPLRTSLALPTLWAGTALLVLGIAPLRIAISWSLKRLERHASEQLAGRGAGQRNGARLRKALTVGQIGVAFALLITLGLLVGSWYRLLHQEFGFDARSLVAASVAPPPGSSGASIVAAADRLRGLPGVNGVSWSNAPPFGRMDFIAGVVIDQAPDEEAEARMRTAGPGFFEITGIELQSGRAFGPEDAGSGMKTIIVDESFERKYLDGSALGRRIGHPEASHTVIGVVASVMHEALNESRNEPTFYYYSDSPSHQTQLVLSTSLDPESQVIPVRGVLENALGEDQVFSVTSVDSLMRRTVEDRGPRMILLSAFTGLALLLVFYGVYALQSYQVTTGTAEIGLRRAVGASRTRILARELGRAAWLLPPGILVGAAVGWFGSRLIVDQFYQITFTEPRLWIVTGLALVATIGIASLVPALRASSVEPLEALRHE